MNLGEKEFKSEEYLKWLENLGHATKESSMYNNSVPFSGAYIPGEVKVAISLRLLAGASYLDMFLWFNINPEHITSIFRHVVSDWFCNDGVMKIDFYKTVLQDQQNRNEIRRNFSTRSAGILDGCIGALDGWLVRISCPTVREVNNPGKYFSRKGFYAINVQAIVDKKRILWRYIGEKGCSHDSSVFKGSSLGTHLMSIRNEIHRAGLYLVGDSAYSIRGFLLTPYENAQPNSREDAFNYFLSNQRIYVECAFGEIDRRWGIFWKRLEGNLTNHKDTIDACLRLHNYIINYREKHGTVNADSNLEERQLLEGASEDFMDLNPLETIGTFGGELDELNVGGRPSNDETEERTRGRSKRDRLRDTLWREGMSRPGNITVEIVRDRHNRVVDTSETRQMS